MGFLCGSKNPNWKGGIKYIDRHCIQCGKVDVLLNRPDRKHSLLCRGCSQKGSGNGNWRGGLTALYSSAIIEKTCPECGKMFSTAKSYKGFCSMECSKRNYQRTYWRMYRPIRRGREGIGKYKVSDFMLLVESAGGICPCCKVSVPKQKFTVDHIVPLSRGGLNVIDNIQPLCLRCNMIKGITTQDYRQTLIPSGGA